MATGLLTYTPTDYKDSLLYQMLEKKEAKRKNNKKKSTGLVEKVDYVVEKATALLGTVGKDAFHDYTLHTPEHSRKLLHIAEYIIPKKTLDELSELELAVLIMSFYLHDIGMVVDNDRKTALLADDEFLNFIEREKDFKDRIEALRKEIDDAAEDKKPAFELQLAQVHEAAITKYLRPLHGKKPTYDKEFKKIEADRKDLFTCNDRSFREQLIAICASHYSETSVLELKDEDGVEELNKNYVCADQRLNMQFCAAVLRAADILDFDAERTPEVLFRALGIEDKKLPGFKISLQEWNKQMAVKSIEFKGTEMEVQADSNSPAIGESIKLMCDDIARELRDTSSFLQNAPKDIADKYRLELPLVVKANISRKGYADKNYRVHLDEKSIMTLLMGENLYERAQVALRELIQNSIDACILRTKVDKGITPEITISFSKDADERVWLMVRDNGIGMDDNVLSNYFFNIGKSYYQSSDFKAYTQKKSIKDFSPISRFGIGILSVFMISDALKVTTQNGYSEKDKKHRTIFIDDTDSLAFVKESTLSEQGTAIDLRLKRDQETEEQLDKLYNYVKEVFVHPAVPIKLVDINGKEAVITSDQFSTILPEKKQLLQENGVEVVEIDLGKYSALIKGIGTIILFKNEDDTLSSYDKNNKMEWGQGILKSRGLTTANFVGNRITVDGVVMRMKKLSTLLRGNRKRFRSILDVEIHGSRDVNYNVSRTHIVGHSHPYVRNAIKEALAAGLKENGTYDKLDEETKKLFNVVFKKHEPAAPLAKEMFAKITPLVPKGEVTNVRELILDIAEELGEDKGVVKPYVCSILSKRKGKK